MSEKQIRTYASPSESRCVLAEIGVRLQKHGVVSKETAPQDWQSAKFDWDRVLVIGEEQSEAEQLEVKRRDEAERLEARRREAAERKAERRKVERVQAEGLKAERLKANRREAEIKKIGLHHPDTLNVLETVGLRKVATVLNELATDHDVTVQRRAEHALLCTWGISDDTVSPGFRSVLDTVLPVVNYLAMKHQESAPRATHLEGTGPVFDVIEAGLRDHGWHSYGAETYVNKIDRLSAEKACGGRPRHRD